MTPSNLRIVSMIATLLFVAPLTTACEKESEPAEKEHVEKAEGGTAPTGQAAPTPEASGDQSTPAAVTTRPDGAAAGDEAAPAGSAAAEQYVRFRIMHHDVSKGEVMGTFAFKVTKAVVDLDKPADAMAEVEVDLATISTGIVKRDAHLKSADFFDVGSFGKATFLVNGVQLLEGGGFSANASLDLHGVKADVPVTFAVVENLDGGGILIEGSADLARSTFGVGSTPEDTNAADSLKVEVRLALMPTP